MFNADNPSGFIFTGKSGIEVRSFIHGASVAPVAVPDSFTIEDADSFLSSAAGDTFVIVSSIFADDIRERLEGAGWSEGKDYIISL